MPTYTGISSEAFRHPLDRQAEQSLRSLPGFDLVAGKFVEFVYERPQFIYHMGNSIQVGPRQYSSVYQMFRECVRDLDISPEPNLFVSQAPLVNAYALGQEYPYVVLNTGLLDLLSETELKTVIAHELGHLKCGHTLLIQMAIWAITTASFIGQRTFGLGNLLGTGLIYAFHEWQRKAELSADRAALLVMDELNPVMNSMMRLAGGSNKYANECSLDEFVRQSEKYQNLDSDSLNQVYKFILYNNFSQGVFMTHPFTVERLTFIQEWANSAEYQQIRQGNYCRSTAVNVESTAPDDQVDALRKEIEDLQAEIEEIKRSQSNQ
ncbi:M48 family metallopeptidase [Synechocystis sp. PCC 7509]|uniref:M48 family metallopeptidase n=1 Tax=Synechocystis sp. PCC 7509 TaxID=927677 RepID=UPI0002AC48EC|nr:M48 family metallopeptidase [Synechocystis sp. PCC 7509]